MREPNRYPAIDVFRSEAVATSEVVAGRSARKLSCALMIDPSVSETADVGASPFVAAIRRHAIQFSLFLLFLLSPHFSLPE